MSGIILLIKYNFKEVYNMNLDKYIEQNVKIENIDEFKDDKYELAIIRLVLKETAHIFYRDYTFFLDKENLKARNGIYNKKFDIKKIDEPTAISFYFKDFDSKELFLDFLEEYNEKMENEDEEKVINYTDLTGLLMSSVKTIVDSVSYVLIAFVSISLIVSSIMIGIITYISVLERTKEIGVLRAIGASKRNISSIFNAETFIVGLCSGALGILATLGLLIPTNIIIHSVNTDITAVLPVQGAIVLVILSVILTLIGGLIPSKQAAKKDPVLALRSE